MILPRNDGVLRTLRASATTLSLGGMGDRGLTAACDTFWRHGAGFANSRADRLFHQEWHEDFANFRAWLSVLEESR